MHTELEVQRCTLSCAGPRLRSQCTLSWEVGKELGEESWQRAWRRVGKAGSGGGSLCRHGRGETRGGGGGGRGGGGRGGGQLAEEEEEENSSDKI